MRFLALVIAGALLLGAPVAAWAQGKSMIDEVKERGVLRAGIKNDVPFIGFVDEKGNNVGFEIDLVTDLARRLGVKIEYIPTAVSTRIQLLQQKRIDLIFATVTHYRSRNEVVDFSIDYLFTPDTLLVKKDSGIKSVADLAGKRAGTTQGTSLAKILPKIVPTATVQAFPAWPEAFFALQSGVIDAIATNNVILQSLRMSSPKPDDYILLGKEGIYAGGYYGIVLRQNDSKSRNTINFLLQDQWQDGTWQRAFDKWFGKDSSLKMTLDDFGGYQMRIWGP